MEPGQPAAPSEGNGPGEDGPDPFVPLKSISAFGCINLNVPAIWPSAWDEKAGMWCCCEDIEDPAADTGTLWIDYDVIELGRRPADGPHREQVLDTLAQQIAEKKAGPTKPGDLSPHVADIPLGKVIRYHRSFETEKGAFIEHRWHSLILAGRDLAVVHYSLVLTAATAARPAWRRLVSTMDGEIRAAELAPADDPAADGSPEQ